MADAKHRRPIEGRRPKAAYGHLLPQGEKEERSHLLPQGEKEEREAHMSTTLGSGEYRYRVVENWAKRPPEGNLTDFASVPVDRQDRIDVFNRGAPRMA